MLQRLYLGFISGLCEMLYHSLNHTDDTQASLLLLIEKLYTTLQAMVHHLWELCSLVLEK